MSGLSPPAWQPLTRRQWLVRWMLRLVVLAVLVQAARTVSAATTWEFTLDAPQQLRDLLARMFPPAWRQTPGVLHPLLDTIHTATLGTLLAALIAFPLALVASRRTTPHRLLRQLALLLVVASRSVNALIWALLLVTILGPGMLAGVLAIALRSIGFLAKLLYETLEETDPEPIAAIRATGAGSAAVFVYGTWPQIASAFFGLSIFRWEINLREATILGLVGAGGLGVPLSAAIDGLEWSKVSLILLLTLGLVIAGESLSARVRTKLT